MTNSTGTLKKIILSKLNSFPVPRNLDLVICSYGGVGTTFLINFLSNYKSVNSATDLDGLKHSPVPPLSLHQNQKFIYVFGDPVYATISLFRRNYQRPQSKKNQRKNLSLNSPILEKMTLKEYAETGIDRLNFRNHFHNWYQARTYNPTLFLRYESLFNNVDTILDFAGLPPVASKKFPASRTRKSVSADVEPNTLNQLKKMHSRFLNELEMIPDIEIRPAGVRNIYQQLAATSSFFISKTANTCLKRFMD